MSPTPPTPAPRLSVAVQAWPGPGDTIVRAVRGPYRASVYMVGRATGLSRQVWRCGHRHPDRNAAFACGEARKREMLEIKP